MFMKIYDSLFYMLLRLQRWGYVFSQNPMRNIGPVVKCGALNYFYQYSIENCYFPKEAVAINSLD